MLSLLYVIIISRFSIFVVHCIFFFFFSSRRRHTRYWRDWSSDVCSSDLCRRFRRLARPLADHSARTTFETWQLRFTLITISIRSFRPAWAGPTASPKDRKERRVGKECRSRWSPYH